DVRKPSEIARDNRDNVSRFPSKIERDNRDNVSRFPSKIARDNIDNVSRFTSKIARDNRDNVSRFSDNIENVIDNDDIKVVTRFDQVVRGEKGNLYTVVTEDMDR